MSDTDRSAVLDDLNDLLERLEDELEGLSAEGRQSIEAASIRAKRSLDHGAETSQETIADVREALDDIESDLDEHVDRGKHTAADTLEQLRGRLADLESRLRD